MQISEVSVKVCFVGPPRQPVHARCGIAFEREERFPEDCALLDNIFLNVVPYDFSGWSSKQHLYFLWFWWVFRKPTSTHDVLATHASTGMTTPILSRRLRDQRAVARYAGLTGSPDESGSKRREKGLARAGNAQVRRGLIQLAAPKRTPRPLSLA
jgi:hypothetical protein